MTGPNIQFKSSQLGSAEFRRDHGVRLAYVSGSMYKAIASEDVVLRMAKAGLLGFFGTGGVRLDRIEQAIHLFQSELTAGQSFGMNLLCNLVQPEMEERLVKLYLRLGVRRVEASAYTEVTPGLALYRCAGLRRGPDGRVECLNHVLGKVSHPEVARAFLSPAPEKWVRRWVESGELTQDQAVMAESVPMADDICVEADSGGHTDQGVAYVIMPVMASLRNQIHQERGYARKVRIGAAGGLGTPAAVAAALMLGADFIETGSINQCTVEAGTSDLVKDQLQEARAQDTVMAPAGDMFEIGARVQVLKRGGFFAARANRLYELYRQYSSLEEIPDAVLKQIEKSYFKRSVGEVWDETREYYLKNAPDRLAVAEKNPKQKMALVFRWYFIQSHRLAQRGIAEGKVDFQIQCGPAMGAFNDWVKGTRLESWRERHVDEIGELLMEGAARYLNARVAELHGSAGDGDLNSDMISAQSLLDSIGSRLSYTEHSPTY